MVAGAWNESSSECTNSFAGASPSKCKRFERRDQKSQKQISDPSKNDHINPIWEKNNVFELQVTRHLLVPGQHNHQEVRLSVWQTTEQNKNKKLCSCKIPVRDLHNKYYESIDPKTTEVTFPLVSVNKDDDSLNDSAQSQKFVTFVVVSVSFLGDWSANLEVEHIKELKMANMLKMEEAKWTEGKTPCHCLQQ